MNPIELRIDGKIYAGWQKVAIVRSVETLAGRFDITLTDKQPFEIPLSGACELRIYDQPIITGYTDTLDVDVGPQEHSLLITGRDKTGDLVDCAALVDSQEMINVSLREIIEEVVEPFGVTAIFKTDPADLFKKFSFQEETAFEAIERACRLRGVFATSNELGELVIDEYGATRAGQGLTLGENVIGAGAKFNTKDRFSVYKVFGQQPGGETISADASANPEGEAFDLGVTRYRPKIIIAEGAVDAGLAQQRAEWEATVRAARASSIKADVQGWTDENNVVWRENALVPCIFPEHRIEGDMLIKEVSFTLDDSGGEKTMLLLVRPDAYEKQPDIEAEEIGFKNDDG